MSDVQKALQGFTNDKQEKITLRVKRYIKACAKMGVPLDPLVRVWQEAIEAEDAEERLGQGDDMQAWPRFEPAKRYEVYTSPIDMKF